MSTVRVSKAVARVKARPRNPYRPPQQIYTCGVCIFRTTKLTRAWSHSYIHGPWELDGSGVLSYELNLSARAAANGLNHPRGQSIQVIATVRRKAG